MTRTVDFEQRIAAVEVAEASRLVAAPESEYEAQAVVAALAVQAEETVSASGEAALVKLVVWRPCSRGVS